MTVLASSYVKEGGLNGAQAGASANIREAAQDDLLCWLPQNRRMLEALGVMSETHRDIASKVTRINSYMQLAHDEIRTKKLVTDGETRITAALNVMVVHAKSLDLLQAVAGVKASLRNIKFKSKPDFKIQTAAGSSPVLSGITTREATPVVSSQMTHVSDSFSSGITQRQPEALPPPMSSPPMDLLPFAEDKDVEMEVEETDDESQRGAKAPSPKL